MQSIQYIDRASAKIEKEAVYYEGGIHFLYGKTLFSRTLGRVFLHGLAKWPLTSWVFGKFQQMKSSQKKIAPFIQLYGLDTSEFLDPVESFSTFNEFFVRHLRPECRPIEKDENKAVIPADARYQFYDNISNDYPFSVKGQNFSLKTLLRDDKQAERFDGGSLIIARLCPTDCHRFYFPVDCVPGKAKLINGKLFSVNPIAIKDNPWIYCVNRRSVTYLDSLQFGNVAFLEIGATSVGSIKQTYTPGEFQLKGAEKGYFSFGSALIMLFEKGSIQLDQDLLEGTKSGLEIRCLIGQSMGTSLKHTRNL